MKLEVEVSDLKMAHGKTDGVIKNTADAQQEVASSSQANREASHSDSKPPLKIERLDLHPDVIVIDDDDDTSQSDLLNLQPKLEEPVSVVGVVPQVPEAILPTLSGPQPDANISNQSAVKQCPSPVASSGSADGIDSTEPGPSTSAFGIGPRDLSHPQNSRLPAGDSGAPRHGPAKEESVRATVTPDIVSSSVGPTVAATNKRPTPPQDNSELPRIKRVRRLQHADPSANATPGPSRIAGPSMSTRSTPIRPRIKPDNDAINLSDTTVARWMKDLTTFNLDLHDPTISTTFTRKHINCNLGGGSISLFAHIKPDTDHLPKNFNRDRSKWSMVLPTLDLNPKAPSVPGEPGLLFSSRVELQQKKRWVVFVRVEKNPALWRYMGDYDAQRIASLTGEDFAKQAQRVKDKWAKKICGPQSDKKTSSSRALPTKEYLRIRARISLRLRKAVFTEDEVNEEMTRKSPLTPQQVIDAFIREEEVIEVISLQCRSYDRDFLDALIDAPPPPPVDNSVKAKGKGKGKAAVRSGPGHRQDGGGGTGGSSTKPNTTRSKRARAFLPHSDSDDSSDDRSQPDEDSDYSP
ncbi:hypothetical protein JAAARDRAFT_207955 [Jaapia argillacea MUCL 33604]|uniref:DUF6697 domain-containing protein n=1 Tax=Jaapia argillacea MUCL 33604 TaxID=933084 RepID=A0A067PY71_9AGAM|nr:hypothetical protein JAAARDRAFT_207955 [Jaapia argillacea MUCL 33604]